MKLFEINCKSSPQRNMVSKNLQTTGKKRVTDRSSVRSAILWGLVITVALLLFELIPSDVPLLQAYTSLEQWDTRWFKSIAVDGYHDLGLPSVRSSLDQERENVAFFPAYPLSARFLSLITGLPIDYALLLAAAFACWGMCTYLLLILRKWRLSPTMIGVTFFLILSFPSAFYLVSAYSEALFFCMLLGMIYWQGQTSYYSVPLSILHGFIMSAARISGLPLALYPLVHVLPNAKRWRLLFRRSLAAGLMMSGGLLFFIFCAVKFGNWKLYMDTQRIGWGVIPDYFAIFRLETYHMELLLPHLPGYGEIGLLTVPLGALWFLILLALECTVIRARDPDGWKIRLGLYYCAFTIFFLSVSGSVSIGMSSIIRYSLGVHLFLVLATMHMLSRSDIPPKVLMVILGAFCFVSFLLLKLHVEASQHFIQGLWV